MSDNRTSCSVHSDLIGVTGAFDSRRDSGDDRRSGIRYSRTLATTIGETVGKEALLKQVWPDRIIEENNLQVQISMLRKTLGGEWIVTVPGRGYRFVLPNMDTGPIFRTVGGNREPAIAVLPFSNFSEDVEQGYLADGIAEEITVALSRMAGLHVIARTSSFAYKGKSLDVRQVGKELGARYVLEGAYVKLGRIFALPAG